MSVVRVRVNGLTLSLVTFMFYQWPQFVINSILPNSTNGTSNPNIVSKLPKQFWLWAAAIFNYWRRKLCQQLQFNRCQKITSIVLYMKSRIQNIYRISEFKIWLRLTQRLLCQICFIYLERCPQGKRRCYILGKIVRCSFQNPAPGLWIWFCWGRMTFEVENWVWTRKFSPILKIWMPTY